MMMIEEREIVFIINAQAGKQNAGRILNELRTYSPGSTFIVTRNEKELAEIFQGQSNEGKIYVAVGGDGTVRKVMELIIEKECVLGIIPIGSGNRFARQMGIPDNVKDAVNILKHGTPVSVDVINVDGHYGLNVTGLGFEAEIAYHFNLLGIRGRIGYVLASIRALWCSSLFYARISGKAIKEEGIFWMIDFANSRQYGKNARIASPASLTDKQIDIVLVNPFPLVWIPSFLFQLFSGRLKPSKYVKFIRTSAPLTIYGTKTKLHIDGDSEGDLPVCIVDEHLTIDLIPKALQVIL